MDDSSTDASHNVALALETKYENVHAPNELSSWRLFEIKALNSLN